MLTDDIDWDRISELSNMVTLSKTWINFYTFQNDLGMVQEIVAQKKQKTQEPWSSADLFAMLREFWDISDALM